MIRLSILVIVACLFWTVTHVTPDSQAHPTTFLENSRIGIQVLANWQQVDTMIRNLPDTPTR